ncbi:MAG: purine-nucleoside phosphorylase [Candidatus Cloacimonetes bacterium 4572_55]|nr:MAG: purine-nucleoside phosphorylase [Candidatus Cloacimonetes bacterium 4572_55]
MKEIRSQVKKTLDFLLPKIDSKPSVGIIFGTGLGKLADRIDKEVEIPYELIPHFPISTVEHHAGKLIFGKLGGKNVVAMQGRFHYYEGYSMKQITFPIRVMKALGCDTLVISNAAGGMNPMFRAGDVMVIDDHINLMGDNPLIGVNDNQLGPRFPDMSEPYDQELIEKAENIALRNGIKLHKGVFVAIAGPNLETRAEYRFLRAIGADVVGMSTVPENLVAVHSSMRVVALTAVTDVCFPDALKPIDLPEIVKFAGIAEKKLIVIVEGLMG